MLTGNGEHNFRGHAKPLGSKSKRTFANALGHFASVVRAFLGLQFFWQRFFRAGFADRGHGFDTESIRNFQLGFGAVVIEAFHAVDNKALAEALQSKVLPGGAAIV